MKIKVTKRLLKEYPSAKFVAILAKNFKNKKNNKYIESEIKKIQEKIKKIGDINALDSIKNHKTFHQNFNKSYPIEFQVNSIKEGKEIPKTTALKDVLFLNEMKNYAIISGHDLTSLGKEIVFDLNDGGEEYLKINNKPQKLKPRDIVLKNDRKIVTSLLYGPDSSTKITDKTKDCIYLFWYSSEISDQDLKRIVNEFKVDLKKISSKDSKIEEVKIEETSESVSIDPWEASEDINYEKLIKEFGIKPLSKLPKVLSSDVLFRRGVIFAHRDFDKILDCIKNKKPFILLTGLMPTGKMHLGHLILFQEIIKYQELGAKVVIAVADIEAYHARNQSLEDSRKIALEEYITNYIALGLNPEDCEIYFQSERSKDAKKSNAFYRLQNLFAKNITFNEFRAVYGEITPGKMVSSLLQAVDIAHPKLPEFHGDLPLVVPVGIDQDPHIRITRDLISRLKTPKISQISSVYHLFMPGLKGGKMSASDPSTFIGLTDTPSQVKNKINKYAFSGGKDTIEEHRKHGGNPDIDISFQYLKMFFEPNDEALAQIEKDYRSGKLLSGELKKILIEKINTFLEKHQKARVKAKSQIPKYLV